MSERTDIPVSTLSKVEHDRLTLTYDKLLQVSHGLKIPLSELLADPAARLDRSLSGHRYGLGIVPGHPAVNHASQRPAHDRRHPEQPELR